MMTSDGHIEFLRRNAVEIAACAYAGHKADGRGLVVVDVDRHDEATGTVPFQFTPERLLAKTIRPYYGTRAAEMVRNTCRKRKWLSPSYRPAKTAALIPSA